MSTKDIKDRIYNKAMAKMFKCIEKVKEYEHDLEHGHTSVSDTDLQRGIDYWKREYEIWNEIMRLNEMSQK